MIKIGLILLELLIKQMNLPDISRVIASYLDNDVLQKLYLAGVMPSLIQASLDQYFWHDRVETLSHMRLPFESTSNWKNTYIILERELRKAIHSSLTDLSQLDGPSFNNEEDNVLVLDILLSLGFKPDPLSIIVAAQEGRTKILRFLLREGSINPGVAAAYEGFPYLPLTEAAKNGHIEAVELLLSDPRVDPDSDEYGTTALASACNAADDMRADNYPAIVKLLLSDRRADPSWNNSCALRITSYSRDNHEMVRLLLSDSRVNPSAEDNQAIRHASALGRDKTVILLLSEPWINPGANSNQAIRTASEHGHIEVVRLLLNDPRVNPSSANDTALYMAIKNGHTEVVRLLLQDPRVIPREEHLDSALGDVEISELIISALHRL